MIPLFIYTYYKIIGVEIDEERAMLAIESIKEKGGHIEQRCKMIINNALNEDYLTGTAFFLYLVPRGLRLILQIFIRLYEPPCCCCCCC